VLGDDFTVSPLLTFAFVGNFKKLVIGVKSSAAKTRWTSSSDLRDVRMSFKG